MDPSDSKDPTSNEYDAQLNIPVKSEDKDRFRIEAAKRGISMSELARQKLFGEQEAVPA